MQPQILTPSRRTLLLFAAASLAIAACHSSSNPPPDGCSNKRQAALDTARTASDSGRILASHVPAGGTGC